MKTLSRLFWTFLVLSLFFVHVDSNAQDVEQCKQIAEKFLEGVSNHSAEGLDAYLAPDFTMAGQQQPIATMVLMQFIPQLGETVEAFEVASQQVVDSVLTLKYKVTYGVNLGTKEATFVFNADNQVKECELLKMRAAVMQAGPAVSQKEALKDLVRVPFKLHHDIPMVKVMVDGVERNFLFDSGAPMIMLNSEFFENTLDSTASVLGQGRGVVSNVGEMGVHKIQSLSLGDIVIHDQELVTTNLSNLSTRREQIYGLIGFSFFSEYDVLFDYKKKELVFINPANTENYIQEQGYQTDWFPLSLNGHVASVDCLIDSVTVKMGFDCGAQANLLGTDFLEEHPELVRRKRHTQLGGIGEGSSEITIGRVNLTVGQRLFKRSVTAFSEMTSIKGALGVDGLIGYQVLSGNRLLVSYANKKMTFLD